MDSQRATQRAYETEQSLAAVEATVRAFRGTWARQQSLIVAEGADPETARPTMDAHVNAIKAAADALGEKVTAAIDDMVAELNEGSKEDAPAEPAEPSAPAEPTAQPAA